MADTRGIRELFEKFKDSEEYDHICDTTYSVEEEEMQIVVAFAESIVEQCAEIAEAHGKTIGDNCWNHENSSEAETTCSDEIALAIRSRWQRGEGQI